MRKETLMERVFTKVGAIGTALLNIYAFEAESFKLVFHSTCLD